MTENTKKIKRILKSILIYLFFLVSIFLFTGRGFFPDILGRLSLEIWAALIGIALMGAWWIRKHPHEEGNETDEIRILDALQDNKKLRYFLLFYPPIFVIFDVIFLYKIVDIFSHGNYVAIFTIRILACIPLIIAARSLTNNTTKKIILSFAAVLYMWIIRIPVYILFSLLSMLTGALIFIL